MLPIVSESEENEMSLESSDGLLRSGMEDTSSSSSSRAGRKRIFNWKVIGFSSCTKSCGGGTQTPIIRCIRKNPLRYYSQRRCTHSVKPVLNENLLHCNTQPCPAYWRFDDWGECRCSSSGGLRRREVSCVQELASGLVIHVDKAACMEDQPPMQKQCECPKNRRRNLSRYRLSGPSESSSNSSQVKRSKIDGSDATAIWLVSDWNQYCSVTCGSGVEYRTVFCDRSKAGEQRCDPSTTPESRRPCEKPACELGDWFTGPWSSCNGDCFDLTRTREVLCIRSQLITEHSECTPELKPQSVEKCSHEEVEYCAARWHYSDWSEVARYLIWFVMQLLYPLAFVYCSVPNHVAVEPSDAVWDAWSTTSRWTPCGNQRIVGTPTGSPYIAIAMCKRVQVGFYLEYLVKFIYLLYYLLLQKFRKLKWLQSVRISSLIASGLRRQSYVATIIIAIIVVFPARVAFKVRSS